MKNSWSGKMVSCERISLDCFVCVKVKVIFGENVNTLPHFYPYEFSLRIPCSLFERTARTNCSSNMQSNVIEIIDSAIAHNNYIEMKSSVVVFSTLSQEMRFKKRGSKWVIKWESFWIFIINANWNEQTLITKKQTWAQSVYHFSSL